ncbi:MAG: twin-arginine translocase TatA/TatE family subunit [Alistipes sp.]|nr:twin-arginine translocase TatA/TatE family subunit [Alistipes sp.]
MFILPLGIIGPTQLIIIVAVIVIFFGGKKIPELMRGMGRGVKEFKDAVSKDYTDDGIADAEIIEDRKAIPASRKRISKTSTARKTTATRRSASSK